MTYARFCRRITGLLMSAFFRWTVILNWYCVRRHVDDADEGWLMEGMVHLANRAPKIENMERASNCSGTGMSDANAIFEHSSRCCFTEP